MYHLLAPTGSDQLLLILKLRNFLFYKTTYLNAEVNSTKPPFSVRFPAVPFLFEILWDLGSEIYPSKLDPRVKQGSSSQLQPHSLSGSKPTLKVS